MNKVVVTVVVATLLAACTTSVPESNRGVGFGDPLEYERQRMAREATLDPATQTALPQPPAVQTQTISSGELAAAGIGANQPVGAPLTALSPTTQTGVATSPAVSVASAPETNNPGISDEQDFGAVSGRETIESDAARRAAQAAAREVVQPAPLPVRTDDGAPNIVAYALNAPNKKGQEWYSRFMLSGQGRFQRNCAEYNSPDAAQRDFLARGGPERDPRGIDPDGDGFACGWDPAPFLLAAGR